MGITRIVVAHRAETIRAAQRVLVAQGGKLIDVSRNLRSQIADIDALDAKGISERHREPR
jgi:ABC-type bacteriocin/lantibiotic exporter with double-glycine peptidase domain